MSVFIVIGVDIVYLSWIWRSYFFLEGQRPLLHFFEANHCSIESFLFLSGESHLNQALFFNFSRSFNSLYLHLFLVCTLSLVFSFVLVVISRKLKYPIRIDEADVVNVISGAFDDLVVDYPFRIHYTSDGSGMQVELFF